MAQDDWTFLEDGLDYATVRRGVTAGALAPPGGAPFVFGFHSRDATAGCVGLYFNGAGFAPAQAGVSIRACLRRAPSSGPTGFAPFVFAAAVGGSVHDHAYLLGLSDDDPHRVALRKGPIVTGLPAGEDAAQQGVLLESDEAFDVGAWLHLRLDVIVQPSGDVTLQVFRNDLDQHPVDEDPPLDQDYPWAPVPGMPAFVDDVLAVNTGSPPLAGGRAGFGFVTADVNRRAFVDRVQLRRHVLP